VLDADKEGFLRSHRSLTQTAGRAARNVNGKVIFYADKITESMQMTIDETNRRREKQIRYNEQHGITPQQIIKSRSSVLSREHAATAEAKAYVEPDYYPVASEPLPAYASAEDLRTRIEQTRKAMLSAAKKLEFLEAARLRDELIRLEDELAAKSKN
jgi:excinuclease ABC subunit B